MITLTTEQAQQIEWALNGISNHPQLGAVINTGPCKEALAAIRAARAQEQAEQTPVAWKDLTYGNLHHQDFGNSIPLYTNPVRTKDLMDAEVEAIMVEQGDLRTTAFARAVIAADREKNRGS